jgi:two-component sensor histidine kinase
MFTQVITERKRADEQIRASLREKEVLLKEIHHRVKNNLQIVSTLLDLQSGHTRDRQALEMFEESRGRVRSMALIHERLYRSQDLARVNFAEYVRQLADDLYRAYKVSSEAIVLELEVDAPPLPIDVAIPCGLLLNELMSNCFKHAFKAASGGLLRVTLRGDGRNIILTVADDGEGFPAGIDFRNTATFGLQLVNTLVEQLQGEIELSAGRGSEFVVRFPMKEVAHNGASA